MIFSAVAHDGHIFGAEAPKTVRELKYEEPKYLTGAIYTSGSDKKLLYRFKRVASRSGLTLNVKRDFTYPDGQPAAREQVVYAGDNLISYQLDELQIGASGSARIQRATDNPAKGVIKFEYTGAGRGPKARTETMRENTLIADMVAPFLVAHWDALVRGEKVLCRYIVIPRSETVGFTFVKDPESRRQSKDVLILKMEASSSFIAALIAPLFFTMEKAPPHRVLEYAGRTTPKLRSGSKWKDLDAVTAFDWDSAR